MIINNETIDHIKVFDETGLLIALISDTEIILHKNTEVILSETDTI